MNTKRLMSILSICIGLLAGQSAIARTLVIGTISDEPVKEIRTFLPFTKYLAQQLEPMGFSDGKVIIARDIDHMASLIRSGQVDLFVDSPLVALAINKKAGSRLLVTRWKKGVAEYHSVIFVRQEGGIASVSDLVGRVVTFEESFSSSGHLLPRIAMAELGIQFSQMDSPQSRLAPDETGFVFSGDDENTIEWVLRGRTDAGAMSMDNFKKRVGPNKDELTIILRTDAIPRHVISISSGISNQLAGEIETALVTMNQSEDGLAVLGAFERTTKFDAFSKEILVTMERLQDPVTDLVGND